MKIVMFEGQDLAALYPLVYLRPVFELRCGALTLRQKVQEKFPSCELHLEAREALTKVASDMYGPGAVNSPERLAADDDVLLVAGGAILTGPPQDYTEREALATTKDGHFIWAFLRRETVRKLKAESAGELAEGAAGHLAPHVSGDVLMRHLWDLISHNAGQISADFKALYASRKGAELDRRVAVAGDPADLYVAEGAQVQPWTFIDVRDGPVVIEQEALVRAHTSIQGPAFIGRQSQLLEARIREGTTIGPVCRVGGEVEESIIHGYSNKYHTGFLGHAYVGEWVNLGALTTNSDLKNDYGTVSVYVGGQPVDTGSKKVGSFIGDHTKTSIGTLLNTRSVVGIMCNLVAGPSVLPKYIPSFCWYLDGRISKGLGLGQSLETARAAMERRGVQLTEATVELIKYTEELTRQEKMDKVRRDRKRVLR